MASFVPKIRSTRIPALAAEVRLQDWQPSKERPVTVAIAESPIATTLDFKTDWPSLDLPAHIVEVLRAAPALHIPDNREDLLNWSLGR